MTMPFDPTPPVDTPVTDTAPPEPASLADPPQPPVPTDPVVTPGYDCNPPQPPPAE